MSLVTLRKTAGDVSVVAAVATRPTIEAGRRLLGYSLATFRSDAGSFAVKRPPPQEICIHPRRGAVWDGCLVLSGNGGLRARPFESLAQLPQRAGQRPVAMRRACRLKELVSSACPIVDGGRPEKRSDG